ncbi:hypothetical protein KCMC57_up51400 [Kitasatospora sp. CMC57]|uniref:Uncharacterized protein n=1 Tax=Kitasatospora sp. CMC57 TaxID=3231513 RepID=A0AB33K5M2_9ACTN
MTATAAESIERFIWGLQFIASKAPVGQVLWEWGTTVVPLSFGYRDRPADDASRR